MLVRKRTGTKKAARTTAFTKPAAQKQTKLGEYKQKRDFSKTAEPEGASREPSRKRGTLRFVVHKHAARNLHFDLRLELGGVMKSWAVPKGPSADPTVKRLAMEVEDHPIEYNDFEGTIPKGEYGGGTVMIWDRGTYEPDKPGATGSPEQIVRESYEKGDMKIRLHGQRMLGSYAVVRTKGFPGRSQTRPSWLLIKHKSDEYAHPEGEFSLVEEYVTSVATGRTMEEIASGG